MFRRSSLSLKLYASHGSLALLAVLLGVSAYFYLNRVAASGELEGAYMEIDIMSGEIAGVQSSFLLHGIENREYGETRVAELRQLVTEFKEDIAAIGANPPCDSGRLAGQL